jgi:hypothetical protein
MNMTQKFFKGDLVQVGEMPVYMSHFTGNCQAIVIGSYTEQCSKSKDSDKQYTLHLLSNGRESSWYEEGQLTFIEPDRFDLLPKGNVHRKVWESKTARDDSLG